ncbi:glycosyltransferase family 32 protein [uncultured Eubacterium sp.]|uniref:glycosyltransferase family 32 protein n=1 Tax=uncultured Eubacterium sp. TaxID=165185 RepID=UPI0025DFA927|nr:glycosyltransferase [uncultured Eubacterium sp.]
MIPKIIHFFWFGNNQKGEKEQKCIDSWKKHCLDYVIMEWNESNVDLDILPFVRQAYEAKKYAFASDVLRLWAIYTYGGIYFDTDVELIKPYDDLLDCEGFIGFENNDYVNTGQCVACEKGNPIIKQMMDYYVDLEFNLENVIKCTEINTKVLVDNGLKLNGEKQIIDGFVVYPREYFNPYDNIVDRTYITDNTYSIHWYANSWGSKRNPIVTKAIIYYHRLLRLFGKI